MCGSTCIILCINKQGTKILAMLELPDEIISYRHGKAGTRPEKEKKKKMQIPFIPLKNFSNIVTVLLFDS